MGPFFGLVMSSAVENATPEFAQICKSYAYGSGNTFHAAPFLVTPSAGKLYVQTVTKLVSDLRAQ